MFLKMAANNSEMINQWFLAVPHMHLTKVLKLKITVNEDQVRSTSHTLVREETIIVSYLLLIS